MNSVSITATSKPKSIQFSLQVQTNLSELTKVLNWFETVVSTGLPSKVRSECEIAIAEGFTNAVRHAHKQMPRTTPIVIEVNLYSHLIKIKIWDCGKPFNLQAKLDLIHQDSHSPLEKENGRGLELIEKLTDSMRYLRRENKRNCLILKKQY